MKYMLFTGMLLALAMACQAQHTLKIFVRQHESDLPLPHATAQIASLGKQTLADRFGLVVFTDLRPGTYQIQISFAGFLTKNISVVVPLPTEQEMLVYLEPDEEHEEEEVVVRSTRISRSIANLPTRVEVISGEELTEKGNMKPGDIRMMLNESTGIQTQQTSATSFNAGIRIQGLEGRYTQLLRDGYPLYAGFSGGLSILQIAPLDLQQVEVIKGAASTLYGGGAIAGLVNLVSRKPGEEPELSFLANGTSAGGLDLSAFYSKRNQNTGLTLFASRNSNSPFDPADIGLTAIPKFERYNINPRLFIYRNKTTIDLGVAMITENRTGGSMAYIKKNEPGFFEKNKTNRLTSQLGIVHQLSKSSQLQFKNSYSRFDRAIAIPDYRFDALQQSSFSELSWNKENEKADWVIGFNVLTDNLNEKKLSSDPLRDYRFNTYGLFIQNIWTVSDRVLLETGFRSDYVQNYGFEWLPRISAMFRIAPQLTTRLGGGFGYKTPSIFTEEAERIQFQRLLPVDVNNTRQERSVGGNWDINYQTRLGGLGFSLNHLFFYTRLKNPLVATDAGNSQIALQNANGYLDTKGMETNIRLTYSDFKLFIGYTYTDANTHFANNKSWLPLTARHRLNNVLMYEKEERWKIGLEAYYFSQQKLQAGRIGKSYWITGLMLERLWERYSIFLNFENFTDTRQSKFDIIYTGSIDAPQFNDIYAPVEGFVVNGGIKLRL